VAPCASGKTLGRARFVTCIRRCFARDTNNEGHHLQLVGASREAAKNEEWFPESAGASIARWDSINQATHLDCTAVLTSKCQLSLVQPACS